MWHAACCVVLYTAFATMASGSKRTRLLESGIQPLSEPHQRDCIRKFPWAVYVGIGTSSRSAGQLKQLWSCSVCGPEDDPQKFALKDANAFRDHANSVTHKKKKTSVADAQNMQRSLTAMRHQADEKSGGFTQKCLLLVTWLVLTSKTLQTFSQVQLSSPFQYSLVAEAY